jgi:hypothetical protein
MAAHRTDRLTPVVGRAVLLVLVPEVQSMDDQ